MDPLKRTRKLPKGEEYLFCAIDIPRTIKYISFLIQMLGGIDGSYTAVRTRAFWDLKCYNYGDRVLSQSVIGPQLILIGVDVISTCPLFILLTTWIDAKLNTAGRMRVRLGYKTNSKKCGTDSFVRIRRTGR
jgi:hypothetical protein